MHSRFGILHDAIYDQEIKTPSGVREFLKKLLAYFIFQN